MAAEIHSFQLIGNRIRDIRQQREMSTTVLAEKIGVTPAYISQIERNLAEPSLSVLRKLARELNVELIFLFANDTPADVMVTDPDHVIERNVAEAQARYQLLTPLLLKDQEKPDLSVMIVKIGARQSDYDEFVAHDYVEFTCVLDGCIEYRTERKTYFLKEGDSIYLKRNVPHLLYNPGKTEAKLLAVLGNIHHRMKVEEDV